jgi:DNA-binding MarR family transcriptional regulator
MVAVDPIDSCRGASREHNGNMPYRSSGLENVSVTVQLRRASLDLPPGDQGVWDFEIEGTTKPSAEAPTWNAAAVVVRARVHRRASYEGDRHPPCTRCRPPARVAREVVTGGVQPVLLGLALGLSAGYWTSRFWSTQLFSVSVSRSIPSPISESSSARGGASPAFLLAQVGAHAAGKFAERLSVINLSPPHAGILRVVHTSGGISQQSLAEHLRILPSRLVVLIDELEERGMVERRADPADRRSYALHLTNKGRDTMKSNWPCRA